MSKVGSIIEMGGRLVRERGILIFRGNSGGRWFVEPERIEEVISAGRETCGGVVVGTDQLAVERFIPADWPAVFPATRTLPFDLAATSSIGGQASGTSLDRPEAGMPDRA